jgi:hypothetical protein
MIKQALFGIISYKIKTSKKRYRDKLKNVKTWSKYIRNKYPLPLIWEMFKVKLRGHIQYYGISYNNEAICNFAYAAERILFKWINRRSQRKSIDWNKWNLFVNKHSRIPVKIYHKLY